MVGVMLLFVMYPVISNVQAGKERVMMMFASMPRAILRRFKQLCQHRLATMEGDDGDDVAILEGFDMDIDESMLKVSPYPYLYRCISSAAFRTFVPVAFWHAIALALRLPARPACCRGSVILRSWLPPTLPHVRSRLPMFRWTRANTSSAGPYGSNWDCF